MFSRSLFAADLPTVHVRPNESWARLRTPDPMEQLALAEEADLGLLRLVGCAALATLLLALATSLV